MYQNTKGFLFATLGVFCFSLATLFIKAAGNLSLEAVTFARVFGTFFFFLPKIIKNKELLKTTRVDLHFYRILFLFVGNFSLITCIGSLKLSTLAIYSCLTPFFIPLFSSLFFNRRLNSKLLLAIFIGFIGALLIIHPEKGTLNFFHIIAFGIPISAALSLLCTNKLTETDSAATILFYYSFFPLCISFIWMMPSTEIFSPPLLQFFLLITVFSTFYQACITKAYSLGNPSVLGASLYFDIVFSSFFGCLYFKECPTKEMFLGSFIIITAGIYVMRKKNIHIKVKV